MAFGSCASPVSSRWPQPSAKDLIDVSGARSIDANRKQSLSEIYDYLTSNEFGRRMRAIVETFVQMREDLDSERRALERIWTKRGKQIDAAALNTAGLRRALIDAADLVDDTGGVEQPLGQGGLTGVYMRQNSKVQSAHKASCPLDRWQLPPG